MASRETVRALMAYLREYKCISHKYARQRFGIDDLDELAQELEKAGYGIKPCYWGMKIIGYRYANAQRTMFDRRRYL